MLKFLTTPPEPEGFRDEIQALIGSRLRLVLLIDVVGFALFGLLDVIVARSELQLLLTARLATIAACGLVYLALRRDVNNRHVSKLGITTFLVSAASIQLMVLQTGGHTSAYYAGLNLVLVGMAVLMPWRWTHSLAVFSGIVGLYNVTILILDSTFWTDAARFEWFVISNFFLVFTGVITIAGTGASFNVRLREFIARHELEALADFRQTVIANLSHEMRTPLTLLLGALSKVAKSSNRTHDEVELLRDAKHSGLELLNLINDLLELSRIDAAMERITPSSLRSGDLLDDIVGITSKYAQRSKIEIRRFDFESFPFVGDEKKVSRILKNLISNSLKFTPRGGVITLDCRREGTDLVFSVQDTGPGIPVEERERVFERFHQGDGTSTRKYGGTGIGLALVREHVEMHGGRVWIESPADGGTLVKVRLPTNLDTYGEELVPGQRQFGPPERGVSAWTQVLVEDPEYQTVQLASAAERRAGVRPTGEKRCSGRVLIVDDNPAILRLLSYQLCGEHEVVLARSGSEAITLAKKFRPSVVVTDMMMPEMDGAELCRHLAMDDDTATIPVVLLTARTGEEARLEARKAGAVAFLTKPCDEEELLASLQAILKKREETARDVADYSTRTTAFVAEGIAHELRNPLGFVVNAQFLLGTVARQALDALNNGMDGMDEKSLTDLFETLVEAEASGQEGIERINQMVEQVAALGDRGAGTHGLCDPFSIADKIETLVTPQLGDRELTVDVEPDEVMVAGGTLHDIVLNLVKNAMDALGDSGRIWLKGIRGHHAYEFRVIDSGPGVPAENREEIFQPFFTTKSSDKGSGLGLAVSRKKISSVGGSLELESGTGKNRTTFCVYIPRAHQQNAALSSTPQDAERRASAPAA